MAQDEQNKQNQYNPGVCNIGREETARRRRLGWISLVVTVAILIILIWSGVNPWWRLLVFFPVTMSASGFLQARYHFCSGFARKGVYNFGPPGTTQNVNDETSKQKDRRRGTQITLYAMVIGLIIAIMCTSL